MKIKSKITKREYSYQDNPDSPEFMMDVIKEDDDLHVELYNALDCYLTKDIVDLRDFLNEVIKQEGW